MRLYIFSSIVMSIIKEQTEVMDIAEDLIPMLLDYQFGHVKNLPNSIRETLGGDDVIEVTSLSVVTDNDMNITTDLDRPPPSSIMLPSPRSSTKKGQGGLTRSFPINRTIDKVAIYELSNQVDVMSMSTRASMERTEREENIDLIKCFAHMLSPLDDTSVFCNRLISLEDYIPMNQVIYKMRHNANNAPWKPFEFDPPITKLRKAGSLVGANCSIGRRSRKE